MAARVAPNPGFSRKLVIGLAKLLSVTTVVFGLLRAPQSGAQSQTQEPLVASHVYDVGSIKPNKSGSDGPSIFTAIEEQLGLKLDSQKGLAEVLVIDHVEKPSEN